MEVFLAGGTGYLGRPLAVALLRRGHRVRVLARPGSEPRVPPGAVAITGDALDPASYAHHLCRGGSFVQLVGVAHPSPAKATLFRSIDLASTEAAVTASQQAGIDHFIYVSVAHPAPVMKAYVEARVHCEETLIASGLNVTILRPWYVLGPHHRWPAVLRPFYWLLERSPRTRPGALRLGLVTLPQMVSALVEATENPARGVRVVEVPEIRLSDHS